MPTKITSRQRAARLFRSDPRLDDARPHGERPGQAEVRRGPRGFGGRSTFEGAGSPEGEGALSLRRGGGGGARPARFDGLDGAGEGGDGFEGRRQALGGGRRAGAGGGVDGRSASVGGASADDVDRVVAAHGSLEKYDALVEDTQRGLDKLREQGFAADAPPTFKPGTVSVDGQGFLVAKAKLDVDFGARPNREHTDRLSAAAGGRLRYTGAAPGNVAEIPGNGRFEVQADGTLKALGRPLLPKDTVLVPGQGEFFVNKRPFPEGIAREVNGALYQPGLGLIAAQKNLVPLDFKDKHRFFKVQPGNGFFRLGIDVKKPSFFDSKAFGIIKSVVKVAANFIPVVGQAVSIGLSVVDAAISAARGNVLGAIANAAGAVAGGITTFASNAAGVVTNTVAAGLRTAARAVEAGANVAQAVRSRNPFGILGAVAGGVAGVAGSVANGLNGAAQTVATFGSRVAAGAGIIDGARRGDALGALQSAGDLADSFGVGPQAVIDAGRRRLFGPTPSAAPAPTGRLDGREGFGVGDVAPGGGGAQGVGAGGVGAAGVGGSGLDPFGAAGPSGAPGEVLVAGPGQGLSREGQARESAFARAGRLEAERFAQAQARAAAGDVPLPANMQDPGLELRFGFGGEVPSSLGPLDVGASVVREGGNRLIPDPDRPGNVIIRADSRLGVVGASQPAGSPFVEASRAAGGGSFSSVTFSAPAEQAPALLEAISRGSNPVSSRNLPDGVDVLVDRGTFTRDGASAGAGNALVKGTLGGDVDRLSGSAIGLRREGNLVTLSVGPSGGLRNEGGAGLSVGFERAGFGAGVGVSPSSERTLRDFSLQAVDFDVSTAAGQAALDRALAVAVRTGQLPNGAAGRDVTVLNFDSQTTLKASGRLKGLGITLELTGLEAQLGPSAGGRLRTETLADGTKVTEFRGRFGDSELSQTSVVAADGRRLGEAQAGVTLRNAPTLQAVVEGKGGTSGLSDVSISISAAQAQQVAAFAQRLRGQGVGANPFLEALAAAKGPTDVARALFAGRTRTNAEAFARFVVEFRDATGRLPAEFRFGPARR